MQDIKIGVIIPCYYSSYVLYKNLESLAKQTKRNRLVLYLINNNSPYTTDKEYQEIINKYSKFFKIIYIKNDSNLGPGMARQIGLNQSQEDYILFMDEDDYLADEFVIEKYLFYAEQGYAVISSLHINITDVAEKIVHKKEQPFLLFAVGDLFKKSFLDKYNIHFHKDNSFYCEHAYFLRQVQFFLKQEKEKTYVKIPEAFYLVYHSDHLETITWTTNKNSIFLEEQIISDALQIQFYKKHIDELTKKEKIQIIDTLSQYDSGNDLILSYLEIYGFNPLFQNKSLLYNYWSYIIDLIHKNKKILFKDNNNLFLNYIKEFLPNYQKQNFDFTFEERINKLIPFKIAVIIPCYHKEEILDQCLQSLSIQIKKDLLTIYIINDCSPYEDNDYLNVRQKYNNLQIKYFKTRKNSGPGVARQLGLDNLENERYVFFLDQDDRLYDEYSFDHLLEYLDKRYDYITPKRNIFYEGNQEIEIESPGFIGGLYNVSFLKNNNITFNKNISYYQEDYLFWINVEHYGKEFLIIPDLIYIKNHNLSLTTLMWDNIKPNKFYPEDTIMFYGETLKTLERYSYHTEVEECLYYHQGLSIIYTYSDFFLYILEQDGIQKEYINKQKLYENWNFLITMVDKYSSQIGYIDFDNALNHKYFKQEFINNSWERFCSRFKSLQI